MKKYEYTGKTITKKEFNGTRKEVTLFQIKALVDIPLYSVKAGHVGGWIEGEWNLSQEGSCWIESKVQVYGQAVVQGDAYATESSCILGTSVVDGNAIVEGSRIFHSFVSGSAQIVNSSLVKCWIETRGKAQKIVRVESSSLKDVKILGNKCQMNTPGVLIQNTTIHVAGFTQSNMSNDLPTNNRLLITNEQSQQKHLFQQLLIQDCRFTFIEKQKTSIISCFGRILNVVAKQMELLELYNIINIQNVLFDSCVLYNLKGSLSVVLMGVSKKEKMIFEAGSYGLAEVNMNGQHVFKGKIEFIFATIYGYCRIENKCNSWLTLNRIQMKEMSSIVKEVSSDSKTLENTILADDEVLTV